MIRTWTGFRVLGATIFASDLPFYFVFPPFGEIAKSLLFRRLACPPSCHVLHAEFQA